MIFVSIRATGHGTLIDLKHCLNIILRPVEQYINFAARSDDPWTTLLWHADANLAKEFEEFLATQFRLFGLEITFRFSDTGLEFLDMWLYRVGKWELHSKEQPKRKRKKRLVTRK